MQQLRPRTPHPALRVRHASHARLRFCEKWRCKPLLWPALWAAVGKPVVGEWSVSVSLPGMIVKMVKTKIIYCGRPPSLRDIIPHDLGSWMWNPKGGREIPKVPSHPAVVQWPLCLDSTSNGLVLCEETNGACRHQPLITTTPLTRPYTALTGSGRAQR